MATNNQSVGQSERATQNRIVKLFCDKLKYEYLGNWEERLDNSNIEDKEVVKYLSSRKYNDALISRALDQLHKTANNYTESLYVNNQNFYKLLRYGAKVVENTGEVNQSVNFIDWKEPENNNFAIAEEVTIQGDHEKRPDIVLYINGIAVGVIELKRSTVSIGDGIRQSIVNQKREFIQSFFSTIQIIFAGNDTEGLKYGTIGTPEKYFLKWKEDEQDDSMLQMDKYLLKICDKKRILELLYDFVLFDGGVKKLPRPHQYFGIKAAQEFIHKKEGGIIWHTQGSGKSLIMVWLAKWILENNPNARVVILTDRIELDKQIERVFHEAGEKDIKRTISGKDLMEQLNNPLPRLLCSLIHKFGARDVNNFDAYIEELKSGPSNTVGELYCFVDECHRSESGKMHKVMKAILNNAVFIGFTGTPLLKKDKQTSQQVFGRYIHTYKFNEAVEDGVVLDLMYEARDIDTKLSSNEKVDAWFEAKTKGLNDFQKFELKKKWGTMQQVLSSKSRLEKIVQDVVLDFSTKPRLNSEFGNAILVAGSIYEATRYFEMFQNTPLKDKCALITSYNPATRDITTEGTGENTETEKEYVYKIYAGLLSDVVAEPGKTKSETYEDKAKTKFIKEPATMKLLVVVDKLLVGFDAPPCTYLYIDKKMQDHGLFQAVCRVNRLDGEDKDFGYIVDYKDLFTKLEGAYSVYASELESDNFEKQDIDIVLKDRLTKGKERLDEALEAVALVCEPVAPPKDNLSYIRYFCGNPENEQDLKDSEMKRTALYKYTVGLIRSYANIADEMIEAGYGIEEIEAIKSKIDKYLKLREEIRMASGEKLDMKTYEADMRHLIDTYIQAEDSRRIDPFENQPLLDIMINTGIADAIKNLPDGIRSSKEAIQETIENNVRVKIIKDHLIDPAYFEEMSKLLSEIIIERKANAVSYEEYLKRISELAKKVANLTRTDLPAEIKTNAQRALYHNLGKNKEVAIAVDSAVRKNRLADWRGNIPSENLIKQSIYGVLKDKNEVERIFQIIKQQNEY
ncbi:MAG: restriction endonuclease subunit R [Candidatus Staskawiczbacteria bacterium RIFOXYB2_FULL_32_9]|uniref:Type I restriction enzyme endonuclease subunit n=1 Tax=Candidatus Staskawiczbacteria bacterium RIFOXYD1_FULL_32_13 TaxID=1802234 RepID=A0A1G2JSF2_9BACT|nr:MAG: Type I site-specific deoxyribonuclease, HsdR family [Parcubacteria group bacterium GW2011_GWC2_32_10]OGZ80571.1 MAG: restriction endonuclease subunit R [Candidatus Staskawiczbacteria bacterium RIFOXYB1_FULL_32_11]OGZ80930.1 MAG: restriction endonuclease subunit R [Candidatus Staskawiczbacteria bacterium RIFOXYA2_FULL_32_7]OGZ81601.1 MAG: restriction endonuclease subunit R [Candidatus Staskawiczbacteria bacterium RIFOXYB2_FULL_32_9]OGZ88146.1 MAG: restriction endonuclease subunit R [Cand